MGRKKGIDTGFEGVTYLHSEELTEQQVKVIREFVEMKASEATSVSRRPLRLESGEIDKGSHSLFSFGGRGETWSYAPCSDGLVIPTVVCLNSAFTCLHELGHRHHQHGVDGKYADMDSGSDKDKVRMTFEKEANKYAVNVFELLIDAPKSLTALKRIIKGQQKSYSDGFKKAAKRRKNRFKEETQYFKETMEDAFGKDYKKQDLDLVAMRKLYDAT